MQPRKQVKIRVSEQDKITVDYLSAEGHVLMWLSMPLERTIAKTHLVIQGSARCDGYLAIRITVNDKMEYPRKRHKNVSYGVGVSIILTGVDNENVKEIYSCSLEDIARIKNNRSSMEGTYLNLG